MEAKLIHTYFWITLGWHLSLISGGFKIDSLTTCCFTKPFVWLAYSVAVLKGVCSFSRNAVRNPYLLPFQVVDTNHVQVKLLLRTQRTTFARTSNFSRSFKRITGGVEELPKVSCQAPFYCNRGGSLSRHNNISDGDTPGTMALCELVWNVHPVLSSSCAIEESRSRERF